MFKYYAPNVFVAVMATIAIMVLSVGLTDMFSRNRNIASSNIKNSFKKSEVVIQGNGYLIEFYEINNCKIMVTDNKGFIQSEMECI